MSHKAHDSVLCKESSELVQARRQTDCTYTRHLGLQGTATLPVQHKPLAVTAGEGATSTA